MTEQCFDRSIFLVDLNMQNICEILISDSDSYPEILVMPTWGMWELFRNEKSRAQDSRSPFMTSISPYRWNKEGFIGWLAEVIIWTKDYPYPMMLRGIGTDNLFHSVDLKQVIDKTELSRIVGIDPSRLDKFITLRG